MSNLLSEVIFYTSRVTDTLKALFFPFLRNFIGTREGLVDWQAALASLFIIAIDGQVHIFGEVRKALRLGQAQRRAMQAESRGRGSPDSQEPEPGDSAAGPAGCSRQRRPDCLR